ncbi:MAG TPA: sensor histidine kinase, partial [Aggregicoccus sp.]|nr:sensor histidine kinase [Aggregicoccus sp.]
HPERDVQVEHEGDATGTWDSDRIAQVLANLLTNALAYSPPGSTVRVSTRGEAGAVRLAVHNEGRPLPPELLARLFQPMERGPHEHRGAGRSVGLGLYIVDQVVRAHGGSVEVTSTREAGTTFTVHLPRAAA